MILDIVTIFPEFFDTLLNTSIIKRAIDQKYVEIHIHNLRDYSHNKHRKIDDTPYGGGVGMLMQFPPFYDVITQLKKAHSKVILLSPQGKLFNQKTVTELATKETHIILLCGHYEGVDARVLSLVDAEISIGDYILTGGEIPAMILIDAITRLIPGVIMEDSVNDDSLQKGWLKYPQYTKPEVYQGYKVPEVLVSGNHQKIDAWRTYESIYQTYKKRPDLIENIHLTEEEVKILESIKKKFNCGL
jgi:tRNA (guanine37-N1)-methyltransferase